MNDLVFTPRLSSESDERARMNLSAADMGKISRGSRWSATVTDKATGTRYRVRGASCGLPRCFCDAVITHIFPR
jgi:hypothetical protein